MKKVTLRAYSTVLLALLVIVGLIVYVIRYIDDGASWALYFDETTTKCTYTLTDRNGVVLAKMGGGEKSYAEDASVRIACYQLVGDYGGNVGTGALTGFRKQLSGYSLITGVSQGSDVELKLNIDSRINQTAYAALAGRKGSALVVNYKTGELICMVSSPSMDPLNVPETLPDGVYLNRCLSSTFTPGSVFKLVTLAAAIDNIDDLNSRSFTCTGSIELGGKTVTCSGVHGTQNIEQAFANSCNCAFGQLAMDLGAETLGSYAEKLGICSAHDLNGIKTAAGNFTEDKSESSYLAWSGIGQYEDLVCPYSMLRIVSAIANGGSLNEPSLLGSSTGTETLLSRETADKIADMMSYNVQYKYGAENYPGLALCAKTGTAEVGNGQQSHAWFVGFLNDAQHPYAFVVLVENGGSGRGAAAPVANAILQQAVSLS